MSFYNPRLIQTSPNLMTASAGLMNRSLDGATKMLNSLAGGIEQLSNYKAKKEDEQYQNMLMQHLVDFQHQNQGTENERIDPYTMSNGSSIMSYIQNPSNYVNGMTADRAGSIWQKFMQERTNIANNQQNMLNSSIKNTAQQQQNIMQNYINQVGDTNKDGLVDIRDLNPTEQTALQGLYGSVANKLLGTVNQHQDLSSKLALQDKYATKKQDRQFAHQDNMFNTRISEQERLAKIKTLNNQLTTINNELSKIEMLDKNQLTPDMISKYNSLKQNKALLSSELSSMFGSSILSKKGKKVDNKTIYQSEADSKQYSNVSNNGIISKKLIPKQNSIMSKITTADLNMPNAKISKTYKTLDAVKSQIKQYQVYKDKSDKNVYYNYLANDFAKNANKFLKSDKQLSTEPMTYEQLKNIGLKEGYVGSNFDYPKNISMAMDALKEAERIGDNNSVKNLSTIIQKLKTEQAQYDSLHSGNNSVGILEKIKNSAEQSVPIINILAGSSNIDTGTKPETTKQALANTVKYLIKNDDKFFNYINGETGSTHYSHTIDDDVAYNIGKKYVIPFIKNYIATKQNKDASTITDKEVERFISNNMIDNNANSLDILGKLSSAFMLGDTMNFKLKEPLRKTLEAIKVQYK